MYRCDFCKSAYLDPRPTDKTIDLAYQRYCTHERVPNFSTLSFFEKLRTALANGYRNHRYGTSDYPSSILGVLAAELMPNAKAIVDAGMRHLPNGKKKGRLLDVGFGNGIFMLRASRAGWDVVGVDSDRKTIESARSSGLDVRLGGVESLNPTIEKFDVITLSHVIEHVHHPVKVLRACNRLLKVNGYLWLETPNVGSIGHRLFGDSWRGLEPPRHLFLFNLRSIYMTLQSAGFNKFELQPYRPLCDFMFNYSCAIFLADNPYSIPRNYGLKGIVKKGNRIAKNVPKYREFITLKAWK
jgi:2-polyprenyl-3-methyl-5-hydroxy-6-metoxy-1,4-benzoquinol methylase